MSNTVKIFHMLTVTEALQKLAFECRNWAPEQMEPLIKLLVEFGYPGASILCITGSIPYHDMYGPVLERISPDAYAYFERNLSPTDYIGQ